MLEQVAGGAAEFVAPSNRGIKHHAHEPAYVMGEIAGEMTTSNVIGTVSTFPAEDTNDQINAFVAGARAVNPEVKHKIT